jgi:hypothetical protein
MAYVFSNDWTDIQELQYNSSLSDNQLYFTFTYQGAKISTGTLSATIDLYKPNGDAITSGSAMTVSASQLSYKIDTSASTSTWVKDAYYFADINTTYTGTITSTVRIFFDIVAKRIFPHLNDDHLLEFDPGMASLLPSGESTFAKWISGSWREIRSRIRAAGNRPSLVIDDYALFTPHKHLALANFYKYCSTSANDHWWELYKEHKEEYYRAYEAAMQLVQYDRSDVGRATGAANIVQPRFGR